VKTPTDDSLVAKHRGFNETAAAIAGTPLPSNASMFFNHPEMLIALRRPSVTRNRYSPSP
jgi:hypothetical protein